MIEQMNQVARALVIALAAWVRAFAVRPKFLGTFIDRSFVDRRTSSFESVVSVCLC